MALSEFADNALLRNKCAMKAKEIAERFAPNIILDKWEEYLLTVVKRESNNEKMIN